jgi:hypothetical protein
MTHQLILWFSPVESGADAGHFAPAVGLLHATRIHYGRQRRSRWFEVKPSGQNPCHRVKKIGI